MAMKDGSHALFPAVIRPWLMAALAVLVTVAIVGILWRGPAILLDLAALSNRIWCF